MNEVCGECGAKKGPWYPYCTKAGEGLGVHGESPRIKVPLPLLQRILAALDMMGDRYPVGIVDWRLLAAELRATVEKADEENEATERGYSMTSEQITELRELHDGCIAQDLGRLDDECVVTVPVYRENAAFLIACNNSIRQLLDEREALLEALKWIQWAGTPAEVAHFNPEACPACAASPDDGHKPDCRLRAALAKAESP